MTDERQEQLGPASPPRLPEDTADAQAILAAIRRRAERIKTSELETATRRFAAAGPMTETQTDILETTADRLIDGILAVPERRIQEANRDADTETLAAAAVLLTDHG